MTPAQSPLAGEALSLVETLQQRFAAGLEALAQSRGETAGFVPVSWGRDEGQHGGGCRLIAPVGGLFDRGSVNVSQVHYDDLPKRRLSSATALSTIVHPAAPRAPSVHMHFSFTEMRDGKGYWRMMADLNPSNAVPADTERFIEALRGAAGEHYDHGARQGDRYFFIPALERHRGATHFYLEGFDSGDFMADLELTRKVAETSIGCYLGILDEALRRPRSGPDAAARQLQYHTLYFFQVLTLDRGTTSGLLVHDQNDVGTLGSLPSHVDPDLLASWRPRLPEVQRSLLDRIVAALPVQRPAPVTDEVKAKLARAVRAHYRATPEALDYQAAGDVVPPTVANHASLAS